MYKALTIAGSDSGGGAGIQADLKTFSALGCYGMSAITAITAQNTLGVFDVQEISTKVIGAQIDAVVTDIGVDGVKTGMLSSSDIIEVVASKIKEHKIYPLVIDPVMVAKSGDSLLAKEAISALQELLLPLATLLTPNIPEAEILTGTTIKSEEDMKQAAEILYKSGCEAVLIKGGHFRGDATDILYDGKRYYTLTAKRINQKHTHGTGCTLSAAITSFLAQKKELLEAVKKGKEYLTEALSHGMPIGKGIGPVNHFYRWYKE